MQNKNKKHNSHEKTNAVVHVGESTLKRTEKRGSRSLVGEQTNRVELQAELLRNEPKVTGEHRIIVGENVCKLNQNRTLLLRRLTVATNESMLCQDNKGDATDDPIEVIIQIIETMNVKGHGLRHTLRRVGR